jgi:GNAT superfamily N-acetyltransferase
MTGNPEAASGSGEKSPPVQIMTLRQRQDLVDQVDALHDMTWDEFLSGAPWDHWDSLFDIFDNYQVLLCEARDVVVGVGHTVPFTWSGATEDLPDMLDEVIARALDDRQCGRTPTALCALAAIVRPTHQNRGLSSVMLRSMLSLAAEQHVQWLVVPVGPVLKHRYPITPMERYARWKRADGSPFDPWIRVHWSLGAEQLCVAPRTAVCTGTVAEWEEWTGMSFPESGLYVVPGALQPVEIDRERDIGRYEDPGVWMKHRVSTGAT